MVKAEKQNEGKFHQAIKGITIHSVDVMGCGMLESSECAQLQHQKSETNGTTPSDVEEAQLSPPYHSKDYHAWRDCKKMDAVDQGEGRNPTCIRWKPAQHWSLIRGLQIGFSVSKVKACKRP
ncbi:hypothetical protein F2P79_000807 [Pimephales promelas]|nr:hypothetical protein F2P79_000807 [Pimephales promelas]